MTKRGGIASGLLLVACSSGGAPSDPVVAPVTTSVPVTPTPPPPSVPAPVTPTPAASTTVEFLGVDGFLIRHGTDALLTAPLFTRPDMIAVSTGIPVHSDRALVEASLPSTKLAGVRAVISGHAHYDHLLDVPNILPRLPAAIYFGNRSARNLLAAFAPDRATTCSGTDSQDAPIPRTQVVALDDPSASVVDYRNCPDKKPVGAPLEGKWVDVPNSNMRLYAVCSEHPDQIGPIHFGPGDVDAEVCTPPSKAGDWKEGTTLAFLIDFLDPKTHAPTFRMYYQDAPSHAPLGLVPNDVWADRPIDLALLCVGASDHVPEHPVSTITALSPRFVIGGHWEDFFRAASEAPVNIPFLDVEGWLARAKATLSVPDRAVVPPPGSSFSFP